MSLVTAKCTQCGSNLEVDPEKEASVCPYCGTAYITQKAINNYNTYQTNNNNYNGATINVYGNPLLLEKHLQNARRAKSKEDWEETEKYYNLAEECDPTCIEAIFYSSYAKVKQSLRNDILFKRKDAFAVLCKSVSIIDDNFKLEKKETESELAVQISKDILSMTNSEYVYNLKRNGYGITVWTDKQETVNLFLQLCASYINTILDIIKKFDHDDKGLIPFYAIIADQSQKILNLGVRDKDTFKEKYNYAIKEIRRLDPSVLPNENEFKLKDVKSNSDTFVKPKLSLIFGILAMVFGALIMIIVLSSGSVGYSFLMLYIPFLILSPLFGLTGIKTMIPKERKVPCFVGFGLCAASLLFILLSVIPYTI